jgi:arginase
MGPAALRLAGLVSELEAVAGAVIDAGDVEVSPKEPVDSGFARFEPYIELVQAIKRETILTLEQNDFAITLGGDHSIALGSIAAALESGKDDLAVLWIDAHADINSPSTSPSGNLHGMPLAALMGVPSGTSGLRDEQWNRLLSEIVPVHRLSPSRVAWLGLRDVDDGERQELRSMDKSYIASMHEVDRFGVVEMMARLDRWLIDSGVTQLWVSFDVDCLDPVLAPGTGTAVRGGLTYREAHLLAELLRENLDAPQCSYRLVGLDVVETNPVLDAHNTTAVTAVEWTASLFGKTILGRR